MQTALCDFMVGLQTRYTAWPSPERVTLDRYLHDLKLEYIPVNAPCYETEPGALVTFVRAVFLPTLQGLRDFPEVSQLAKQVSATHTS